MEGIIALLIPVFLGVVLPVSVVLIIAHAGIKEDNNRAKILIKAIEANCNVNADKLAESLRKPKKTAREILNLRLLRGCIFSFIGLVLVIVGIVSWVSGTVFSTVTVFLVFGGVSLAVGLSFLVVWLATRKQVDKYER